MSVEASEVTMPAPRRGNHSVISLSTMDGVQYAHCLTCRTQLNVTMVDDGHLIIDPCDKGGWRR